ncbi:non-ribosomal peptide synthetase [Sorangium sp. So ce204]|uniref:non-ribosomal peptide synthetase n=1 Tax=Sorangium sp. So ce204 TaxID=3133288 RepID=UPI003F647C27
MRRALESVVARHDALRTRFALRGTELSQIVDPEPRVDWCCEDGAGEIEGEAFAARASRHVFDLSAGPLVRASLLRAGPRRRLFVLNIHHIVCDGWSMGVIARELQDDYHALRNGTTPSLTPASLQLKDFTAWCRRRVDGPEGRAAAEYWRSQLGAGGGPRALELATDRPRPPQLSYAGRVTTRRTSPEQARRLMQLAQRCGTTLFTVLTALVKVLLFRETRQSDIAVGAPLAVRDHAALREQIGFYVNTVVLRSYVDGAKGFVELVEQLRAACIDAQAHAIFPFDRVVDELRPPRDPSRAPFFDVMVALQREDDRTLALDGISCARIDVPTGTSKFDLSFDFVQSDDGLLIEVEFATDLFDVDRVERLTARLLRLMDEVHRDPTAPLSSLPLLPPAELATIRALSRGPVLPSDGPGDLLARFRAVLSTDPLRTAIVCGDQRLGYAELAGWSCRIARCIEARRGAPIDAGGPVAVMLERSAAFFAVVLGVLSIGRAYVPIDPGLPPERVRLSLDECAAAVIVTRAALAAEIGIDTITILDPFALPAAEGEVALAALREPGADALAYAITTSGSTGQPKAVGVTRGNLWNAIEMWRHDYRLDRPVVLQLASFCFDVSVGDLGRSLLAGGTLIVATDDERVSPAALVRLIERYSVDFVEMTPLIANALRRHLESVDQRLPFLRLLVVGSDTWRFSDHHALRARIHADTRLINSYGTTETTIDSAYYEPDAESRLDETVTNGPVPIGRPMANVEILILDADRQLVGVGTPGEIHIAGPSVAAGYLGRPELTAERFASNPLRAGDRMYRTGDRGAWRADGNIVLLGRADRQTKIRGYRVELEEIERVIALHRGVSAAVVLVIGSGADAELSAFVVGPTAAELPDIEASARARLPHFMVPGRWVVLDALPANASGKVDRNVLAAMVRVERRREAAAAPRTLLEQVLLDAWTVVLDATTEIGIFDSFFSVGGNSIQVIQLVLQLRERGVRVSAAQIFRHPTIASCAAHLEGGRSDEQRLDPLAVEVDEGARRLLARDGDLDFYPAVAMQSLMLDAGRAHASEDAVYHGFTVWELEDPELDVGALRAAIRRQLARQTALRVAFARGPDGRWHQRVRPVDAVVIEQHDLSHLAGDAQDHAVEEITRRTMARAFDFDAGEPACRVMLLRRRGDACALVMVTHHAVDDGWGAVAFENAVWSDYADLRAGKQLPDPAPLSAARQLVALEAERLRDGAARAYWSEVARRLPPRPYPAPAPAAEPGPRFSELSRVLPAGSFVVDASASVKAICLSAVLRALAEDAKTDVGSAWVVTNGRSERLDAALEAAGLFWTLVPVVAPIGDRAATAAAVDQELREGERRGAWLYPDLFADGGARGFPVCFNFTHFHHERQPPGTLRVRSRRARNVWHFALTLTASVDARSRDVTLHAAYDAWVLSRPKVAALLERVGCNLSISGGIV